MDILLSQFDTYLQSSLLASLIIAFAGGVLASLTPCVYPMIPITAGVIGHANIGGSRWRGFVLSLIYVTGMALTYAALGVFAAATGRFFGAINSSPWTFLLVGNIILLFALGMLDVVQLPTFAGRMASRRLGMTGIFVAGISSALVAGPCTTPVLGTLLAYTATTRSLVAGGLLLFVFSLGMGALLLGVGTFSSFLASIPRSGSWMVKIKKIMGWCMLALAQYFFIKAGSMFL
ncbi:Protein-disulfide reductase [Desulfobulbus propionicus DSM 2032]|jgi:thiol:disulfide interchange protein DsbD|uniref:Protein-disulfide reductase n=1 Tax=Desulfobulbus propionicus (strain ATCC 33891 / DSM 2032 / VKM B-1956 / 1pr3) TaxID=577650 RepID=A0A7U4DNB1_DESPD|nr:cytochrome c biogenesis protein CcdA [Desulfobulbus propionicus]ADW16737.1 Protein-disulfide reductase [Desulfobulbus propionicus DSM 2032]